MFLKLNIKHFIRLNAVALAVFLFALFGSISANAEWKGPSTAPPGGNILAPLNIGTIFSGDVAGTYDNLKLNITGCINGQVLSYDGTNFICQDSSSADDLLQVLTNGANAEDYVDGVYIGSVSSSEGFLDVGGPLTTNWLHIVSDSGLSTIGHNLEIGGKLGVGTTVDNSSIKIQNTGNSAVFGIDARRNINGIMAAGATGGRQTLVDVNAGAGNIVNQVRNFDWIRLNSGTVSNVFGNRVLIDGLGGTATNAYLFYGVFTGSGISAKYGIYLTGEEKNYFSGKVGIGTTAPNSNLHIANNTDNSEIDIQSVSGVNNHWGIYNKKTANSLIFWRQSNVLELFGGASESETAVDVKGELCLGGVCKGSWPSGGTYIGKSIGLYNGNQSGYVSVNQYCSTSFSGSHVCSNEEMLNSVKVAGILPSNGGIAWVNGGGGSSANDCIGWSSNLNTSRGIYWVINGSISAGYTIDCAQSLFFACCK